MNGQNRKRIANGGIELILWAMRNHPEDSKLQYSACGAIYSLTNNSNKYATLTRVKIVAFGGVEMIIYAMRASPKDEHMQYWGCAALWSLAVNSCENQHKITSLGGL